MNLKRLAKKMILGGPIAGHIQDAIEKTAENGGSFLKNLQESVKETITEDMPGTSHIYESGRYEGRKQGTVEQAQRDAVKTRKLNQAHAQEREKWREIDKKKDDVIKRQNGMIDELSGE